MTTYKVFLMKKGTSDYEKLVDIKDFPDLGGAPEMLEKTTLSDRMRTYEPGIQDTGALAFTANYSLADYEKVKELKDQDLDLAVFFGGTEANGIVTPTGSDGKFGFKGKLDVYVNGGGVNEIVDMTITIAPSTTIELIN